MDRTISFLEMDMAKKICNQNFDKRWVVHNLNLNLNRHRLDGSLFKLAHAQKTTRTKISQKHNKKNKS
jgi:hypothetical protein